MRAYERLIRYARIHTASQEGQSSTPSTVRQFDLAAILEQELTELGAEEVAVDEHAYVYARLPATPGYEHCTPIGFLAHMDTVPDFSGEHVRPRLIRNYNGQDIPLGASGRVLSPRAFPHLRDCQGKTLIVTNGNTVLGADDKAGVAEIMTLAERLLTGSRPHGPVSIAFCPDEEIGHGAALLDLQRFGAELAYTVDGGAMGEIEYENFNAAVAEVQVSGFSVHPGAAKNLLINASLVVMQFNSLLPAGDTPRFTEGYEGYFHLTEMSGDLSSARASYLIRDHDAGTFAARKHMMEHAAKLLNERYGPGTVKLTIRDQYRNMIEHIRPRREVVEKAMAATRKAGLTPVSHPIRGGTDGAQLSYRGLPCPNLPTGSYGHHGPYEHAVVEEMDLCVTVLENIVAEFAGKY